jgi:predicted RND superfamily exporter protein
MNKASGIIIKFRWLIIISFIAITAIFFTQIPKTEIDPDIKNQLPDDMTSRINTDKIDEIFGGTEMLMVLIKTDDVLNRETLKRVKKISKQMKRVNGVEKVLSLFELKNIKGEDGTMIVDPAVKRIPRTDQEKENLRKEIIDNDIVYGSVVSENRYF